MAGNDSIQFARAAHEVITTSEEVALDGQPIFDSTNNKLFVGNGIDGLKNLKSVYANYDLIIDNQSKFTSYLANNYGRDAKSVLLVNNGVNYSLTNNAEIPQGTVLFESIDGATITLDGYSLNCELATVRGINFIVNRVSTAADVTFITSATALENVSAVLSSVAGEAPKLATIFANTPKCNNCYVSIAVEEPFWSGFTLFSGCDEITNLRIDMSPVSSYFGDDYHIANSAKIVTGVFDRNENWFNKPYVNCRTVITDDRVEINGSENSGGGLTAKYINTTRIAADRIEAKSITTSFSNGGFIHVGKGANYKIEFGKTYQIIFIGNYLLPAQPSQTSEFLPPIQSQIIFSLMSNAVVANTIQPIEMPPTFCLLGDNLLWIGTPRITFDNITKTDVMVSVSYSGIKSDGTTSRTENSVEFYIRELK